MRLAGATEQESQLGSLLGFFGDEAGPKLKAFGAALKSLSNKIKYLQPGDPPIEIVDDQVRVFVLGPPREKELLEQSDPSKKDNGSDLQFRRLYGPARAGDAGARRAPDRPVR